MELIDMRKPGGPDMEIRIDGAFFGYVHHLPQGTYICPESIADKQRPFYTAARLSLCRKRDRDKLEALLRGVIAKANGDLRAVSTFEKAKAW